MLDLKVQIHGNCDWSQRQMFVSFQERLIINLGMMGRRRSFIPDSAHEAAQDSLLHCMALVGILRRDRGRKLEPHKRLDGEVHLYGKK